MPPKSWTTTKTSNIIRLALAKRDPILVLDTLRVKTTDLPEGQMNHVGMDMLPQLAFLCSGGDYSLSNNPSNSTISSAKFDPVISLCGLVVLETWSLGVPKMASDIKVVKMIACDEEKGNDDQKEQQPSPQHPEWMYDFANEINKPNLQQNNQMIPLTEGTASLYLRLVAQVVVAQMKGLFEAKNLKLISKEQHHGEQTHHQHQLIDLAGAYRFLIRALDDQNTKQASQVQYSSELKKFTLRRRFFSPILQVAADQGLPLLCLEVLASVEEFRSNLGGLKASMVRMLSDSRNKNDNNEKNNDAGEVKNADAAAEVGDEETDLLQDEVEEDHDDEEEENDVVEQKVVTEQKESGKRRQRDDNNNDIVDPDEVIDPANPRSREHYLAMRAKKHEKREENRKMSSKKHDQNQSESCELWECDFALMIEALANYVVKSNDNKNNNKSFMRDYLDRVFTAVSVSTPLVGSVFVQAIHHLKQNLSSSDGSSTFFNATADAKVNVNVDEQHRYPLNDTSPCTCTACHAAVGGPTMELNSEEARMLADAIKTKLILPRIEKKIKFKTPQEQEESRQKFAAFEKLCRETLDPTSIVVDGANIGFYGVRAWYPEAKKELLKRKGIPESEWAADELDVSSRRSRGIATEVAPSFSQLTMTMTKMGKIYPNRDFVVVLHERHLSEEAVNFNMNNREVKQQWAESVSSCSRRRETGDGQDDDANSSSSSSSSPRIHLAASPAEVNDDWCWMYMSLCFSARSYPSKAKMDELMTPSTSTSIVQQQPQQNNVSETSSSNNNNITTSENKKTTLPVIILTNDLMRDHITGLLPGKEEAGWKFLRYRWLHQVKCTIAYGKGFGRDAILKFPSRYHTWPVKFVNHNNHHNNHNNDSNSSACSDLNDRDVKYYSYSWHIPFTFATLKQGTAKVGLVAANNKNKKQQQQQQQESKKSDETSSKETGEHLQQQQQQQQQREVRLPEQLLDMLSFAKKEADGKMLCIQF